RGSFPVGQLFFRRVTSPRMSVGNVQRHGGSGFGPYKLCRGITPAHGLPHAERRRLMALHKWFVVGIACLALVAGCRTGGEPFPANDEEEPNEGQAVRPDVHGDPMPAGAIARLGTVRFRTSLNGSGAGKQAMSPHGKIIATASEGGGGGGGAVTGKALNWFPAKVRANAIAFTPDGKTLLTDSQDCSQAVSIQQWEVGTGKLLREKKSEIDPNSRRMGDMGGHFSADGKTLIVTS